MFLSDNTNIHGFWLEVLREFKKSGTGTQQAKASKILDEGIGNTAGRVGFFYICFHLDIVDVDIVHNQKTARSNTRLRRERATTSKFIFHGSQVGNITTGAGSTATCSTTYLPHAGHSNSESAERHEQRPPSASPVPLESGTTREPTPTPDHDPEHEQEPQRLNHLGQSKTWPGGKVR